MNKTQLAAGIHIIIATLTLLIGTVTVSAQNKLVNINEKQTDKPSIVFMVTGQSNANGVGILSPALHKEFGLIKIDFLESPPAGDLGGAQSWLTFAIT